MKEHENQTQKSVPKSLKNKRILQILPMLSAGGVEQGTLDISKALTNEGAQAFVAASGGVRITELRELGGHFIPLPLDSKNPFYMLFKNTFSLMKVIKEKKIDLIHARSRGPGWSGYLACLLTKTPFVTTFHGTYNFKSKAKKFYNSSMVRGNSVIAISDFIQQHLLKNYDSWVVPEQVTRIYRGIDTKAYDPQSVSQKRQEKIMTLWRLKSSQKIFLMPGRLTRWKGQETAIRSLAHIKNPELVLVIVGSDQGRHAYRQELLALSYELGLQKQVRIVEHCDDMPAAYSVAHGVIHASTDPEAFGRVVAEGQAMGLPCLVSNLGAPREIICDQETGWLVPAGQENSLAEKIKKVMNLSEQEKRNIAQKARKRVKENFSLEKMCSQTLTLYKEILSSCS